MTTAPLRRDAARNRERLLDAAAAAFREEGLGASVNAIAASAGVNVATLYRHFPTKDDLVAAVRDVGRHGWVRIGACTRRSWHVGRVGRCA